MTLTLRGLPVPEGRARGLHRIYPIPYLPVRDTADAWNPRQSIYRHRRWPSVLRIEAQETNQAAGGILQESSLLLLP